jgi:chromosome segregation ATPase
MNDSNLTPEQRRQLDSLEKQIDDAEAQLKKEQESKAPLEYKRERERKDRELRELNASLTDAEAKRTEIEDRLRGYRSSSYTDTSANNIYKFNIDGEEVRLSGKGNSLKNLLRQFCVNFSNFNNPFPDTYTAAEKKELIESITGQPEVQNTGTTDNPTPHSFD